MHSPADVGNLQTNQWEDLRRKAELLEEAWQTGGAADLHQFLPAPGHPLRALTLLELIKTDLEIRWQRKQAVGLDFYLNKFPELGGLDQVPAALVYEEYRVRHKFGDRPTLQTFQARYPRQYPELQILLRSQPIPMSPANPPPTALAVPSNPSFPQVVEESPALSETMMATAEAGPLQIGGGYRLVQKIGTGGFGEVWRAEAPGGIEVAIKVLFRSLDHEEAQREVQSLQLIKQLRHPFLLQTQAFWAQANRLYIVMELADGSLRDRLKECRQQGMEGIPPEEMVRYFQQAAQALDYLHKQGLQHRDIKPDNILLLNGYAKVADFGLARLISTQRSMAVSGSGTPAYMAPEMWGNKVSHYTDQYCLAVTYAELRLGRRLFPGRDLMELMMQHVSVQPNLDPLPQPEQSALRKALDKQPAQRYPNCQEFIAALEAAIGLRPTPLQPTLGQVMPAGPGPSSTPHVSPASSARVSRAMRTGDYDLFHPIPSGNRGESWKATGPDGKAVALTLIRNLPFAQAREELKNFGLLKTLNHPHLNKVHACWLLDANGTLVPREDLGKLDSSTRVTLSLASDLIPNNLSQRLDQCLEQTGQPIPVHELLRYLRQAAAALDFLNTLGHPLDGKRVAIRHCAVNPDNLLLEDNRVKLGDYSQCKVVDNPSATFGDDTTNLPPSYAAPELFENLVTASSDQYSLGVTYYHLRTGTLPFSKSGGAIRIIQHHLEGKLNLEQLPEPEQRIITQATARKPEARFASCAELVTALEQVCQVSRALPAYEATLARPGPKGSSTAAPPVPLASQPGSLPVPPAPPAQASLISQSGQSFHLAPGEDFGKDLEKWMETSKSSGDVLLPAPEVIPSLPFPMPPAPGAKGVPPQRARAENYEPTTLTPPPVPGKQAVPPPLGSKKAAPPPSADQGTILPGQVGSSPGGEPPPASPPAPKTPRGQGPQPKPAPPPGVPADLGTVALPPLPGNRLPAVDSDVTIAASSSKKPASPPPLPPSFFRDQGSPPAEVPRTPKPAAAGKPPVPAGGKTSPQPPKAGWKKLSSHEIPVVKTGTAVSKVGQPRTRGWLAGSLLAAILVVAAVGLWLHFHGKGKELPPPPPPISFEEVEKLISQKQYRKANEALGQLAQDPSVSAAGVEPLHEQVRTAWYQEALGQFKDKHYDQAAGTLSDLLTCYPTEITALELRKQVQEKHKDRDELLRQGRKALAAKYWKQVLQIAQQLLTRFPEQENEARQLRLDALALARNLVQADLKGKKYKEAYEASVEMDDKELTDEVWKQWLAHARGLLASKPEDARKIAQHMKRLRSADAEADELDKAAQAKLALQLPDPVRKVLEKFGDALRRKDVKGTRDALGQVTRQLPSLSGEQQKEVGRLLADMVRANLILLARAADTTEKARSVVDLVRDLDKLPWEELRFDCHMARAHLLLRAHQYKACLASLKDAEGAKDPEAGKIDEALANLTQAAEIDAKITKEDLLAVLDQVKSRLAPYPEGPLGSGYCRLVSRLVTLRLPHLAREGDYQELLPYCRDAVATGRADDLTAGCYAECLLLYQDMRLGGVKPVDLDKARKAVRPVAGNAPLAPYLWYVRGLVFQAEYNWPGATEQYQKSFSIPLQGKWQTPVRLYLAARAYCKAAEKVNAPARAFAMLHQAFVLLRHARQLKPQFDLSLFRPDLLKLVDLAKQNRKDKEGEEVATQLLQGMDDGGKEAYTLLLQKAEFCKHLGEKGEALACYEVLIDWRLDRKSFIDDLEPLTFNETILEPALLLVHDLLEKEPSDRVKARAARIYWTKGRMLLDFPYEQWKFKKPAYREAANVLANAIDLHPNKDEAVMADYHAGHGFALANLAPRDMPAVRKDWNRALQLDEHNLWGLALKAHYYYLRAAYHSAPHSAGLLKDAEMAAQTYERAIQLAQAKGRKEVFLASCHGSTSIIYVLLANNRSGEKKRRLILKDLERAEKEALKATELAPNAERGWAVLGNAREDLAWSELGGKTEFYPKAIEAFEKQKENRRANPQGNVNEARTYIKWAMDDPKEQKSKLTEAQRELDAALQKDSQHAEGNYWQGKLFLLQIQKPKALEFYGKALSHPTLGRYWLPSIKRDLRANERDWRDLFALLLPDKRENYGAKDAQILLFRYEIFNGMEEFEKADLTSKESQLIADASDAARLAPDHYTQVVAHSNAADARLRAFARTKDKAYRDQALKDIRMMYQYYPEIPVNWGWANTLAKGLEAQAKETAQQGARTKLLKEAIKYTKIAIEAAPATDKTELRKYLGELQEQLNNPG